MDSTSRDYVPFEPITALVQEDDCDTLFVHLPGFKKEQLKLQLISSHTLRMTGECPMEDKKWSKLQKEYPIPRSCDTSKITAKFEDEILYIRQPKLIIPALKEDKEQPTNEAEKEPQKNATEPPQSQTTATANDSERRDEAKSREETEAKNAEKVYSKAEKTTDAETATPKPLEEGKKEQKGNGIKEEEKETRKRSNEDESGDFMRSKVQMVKKTGRMTSIVVLILSAIVLGIYVKNWIKPKRDYKN